MEPTGAYSHLPLRKEEEAEEEDKKLTGKDLLSFARQIAAGMVSAEDNTLALYMYLDCIAHA